MPYGRWVVDRRNSDIKVVDVTGVLDVCIRPTLRIIRLAESFAIDWEVHDGGARNVTLTAVQKSSCWYERGLMHPFRD